MEVFNTDGMICGNCYCWLDNSQTSCPKCGAALILEGTDKNIIDRIEPNCLIHRYDGSDMLEPAAVIKEGKVNIKVATKLKEYASPVTVPKTKVYSFDHHLFSSIQALRNERTAVINRYDKRIQNYWQRLKPLKP